MAALLLAIADTSRCYLPLAVVIRSHVDVATASQTELCIV